MATFDGNGGWTQYDYFGTDGRWHNHDENGQDWIVERDNAEWDPIMGEVDDYPETDDEWLDDFQGEEDFA